MSLDGDGVALARMIRTELAVGEIEKSPELPLGTGLNAGPTTTLEIEGVTLGVADANSTVMLIELADGVALEKITLAELAEGVNTTSNSGDDIISLLASGSASCDGEGKRGISSVEATGDNTTDICGVADVPPDSTEDGLRNGEELGVAEMNVMGT